MKFQEGITGGKTSKINIWQWLPMCWRGRQGEAQKKGMKAFYGDWKSFVLWSCSLVLLLEEGLNICLLGLAERRCSMWFRRSSQFIHLEKKNQTSPVIKPIWGHSVLSQPFHNQPFHNQEHLQLGSLLYKKCGVIYFHQSINVLNVQPMFFSVYLNWNYTWKL